jgi:predicted dehydrogenase
MKRPASASMLSQASRREFLTRFGAGALVAGGGLAGAAEPAAPAFAAGPQPESEGKELGVALVGLGGLSTHQLVPALEKSKRCRLAAAVSGSPEKLAAWGRQYGIPERSLYTYDRFDAIREDPAVDLVYIVLPNSQHCEFTERAALAGKHVLVEKPMAVSVAECDRMIAACKTAKVRLGVAYRCQFEPHHVECMRLSRERVLGPLRYVEAGFGFAIGAAEQWRLDRKLAGGGALMDVGIYALQAVRYLVGEEPTSVVALEVKTDPKKFATVDESIGFTLTFPSGVLAQCSTTYRWNGTNSFRVTCDNGWFELDSAYGYGGQHGRRSDGVAIEYPAVDHFATMLDAFAAAITSGQPCRIDGEDGRKDLIVIEAIYRSIAEGRRVAIGA